jgi:hypothetical protein
VLEPELVARLQALLEKTHGSRIVPASPHPQSTPK